MESLQLDLSHEDRYNDQFYYVYCISKKKLSFKLSSCPIISISNHKAHLSSLSTPSVRSSFYFMATDRAYIIRS